MQLLLSIFAVLLSIYIVFKALQKRKSKLNAADNFAEEKSEEVDPLLQEETVSEAKPQPQDAEKSLVAEQVKPKAKPKKSYIAFSIVPKQQDSFAGRLVLSALKGNGFHLGQQNLFHLHDEGDESRSVLCSVASLVEPGTFSEEIIDNQYPGLLLFMNLAKPENPTKAFDAMLKSMRMIAAQLNGQILDNDNELLTAQLIKEHRNAIKQYASQNAEA